jgi:hypothetical protein
MASVVCAGVRCVRCLRLLDRFHSRACAVSPVDHHNAGARLLRTARRSRNYVVARCGQKEKLNRANQRRKWPSAIPHGSLPVPGVCLPNMKRRVRSCSSYQRASVSSRRAGLYTYDIYDCAAVFNKKILRSRGVGATSKKESHEVL